MLKQVLHFLKPSKTVPTTPWMASKPWSLRPTRVIILFVGLTLFGLGDALIFQSTLGNSPWAVLAEGLSKHTPLDVGWSTVLIGFVVLLLWIPLKQYPGFGTISNIFLLSFALQLGINIFPIQHHVLWIRVLYVLGGIAIVGVGSCLYITTGLGPGPRDGLMTGIHRKSGVRVGRVRLCLEVLAMTAGWAMGGRLGLATFLFAFFIGNSLAICLDVLRKILSKYSGVTLPEIATEH